MTRKILGVSTLGMLLGAALAVAAPPAPAVAAGGCKCKEGSTLDGGDYKCNSTNDRCDAGKSYCMVTCTE